MSGLADQGDILPINRRMVDSLKELARVLDEYPHSARFRQVADHLQTGGKMQPSGYGQYFRLIRALQDETEIPIQPLITALSVCQDHSHEIAIKMLGPVDFGRVGTHMVRLDYASDSLGYEQMGVVPTRAHARVRRDLRRACDLIETKAPKAWFDVSRITAEIIAAYGISRDLMNFDGCSSLERHGAILLNMRKSRTPLVLAETLVHESAHGLLFALSCYDHRVLNPHSERYASPLRIDPRPLDGIYHAVFVLARMYSFLIEVAQNPATSKGQRAEAQKLSQVRQKNFLDGYAVLEKHAQLTPIGRSLLDESYALVQGSA